MRISTPVPALGVTAFAALLALAATFVLQEPASAQSASLQLPPPSDRSKSNAQDVHGFGSAVGDIARSGPNSEDL